MKINENKIKLMFESLSNKNDYAFDQFYAIEVLKNEVSNESGSFISKRGISWIDAIIEGGYRGLEGTVAFEIKHVIEADSLKFRLSNFLYKLLELTEIRSAFFVIFDSQGKVEKNIYEAIIEEFEGMVSVKICDFEDYTGKKIPKDLNKVFEEVLKVAGISFSLKEMSKATFDGLVKKNEDLSQTNFLSDVQVSPVTLCLGAGVSKSAKMLDWNGLIEQLWIDSIQSRIKFEDIGRKEVILEVAKIIGNSPLIQARTVSKLVEYGLGHKISKILYKNCDSSSSLIESICNFIKYKLTNNSGIQVITFNYDDLIEINLAKIYIDAEPIYGKTQRNNTEKFPIYHVHGYLPRNSKDIGFNERESLVFSEDSYHLQFEEYYSWQNLTILDSLLNRTCIFVGCSMVDPNMRRLLEASHKRNKSRYHYCFMVRSSESEDRETAFAQRKIRNIYESSLSDIGVKIVWCQDYEEIPRRISELTNPDHS